MGEKYRSRERERQMKNDENERAQKQQNTEHLRWQDLQLRSYYLVFNMTNR